jgi:hypothetical protein
MDLVHARISHEETSIFVFLQATSTVNIEAEIKGLGTPMMINVARPRCRAF